MWLSDILLTFNFNIAGFETNENNVINICDFYNDCNELDVIDTLEDLQSFIMNYGNLKVIMISPSSKTGINICVDFRNK